MAKYKRELNENGHQVSRDRHLRRFLKRILYFKPTTFIGTVVLTAIITAIVQKGMERPKNKFHHKPKNPIVQRQSGTNYGAPCSNCGSPVKVNQVLVNAEN